MWEQSRKYATLQCIFISVYQCKLTLSSGVLSQVKKCTFSSQFPLAKKGSLPLIGCHQTPPHTIGRREVAKNISGCGAGEQRAAPISRVLVFNGQKPVLCKSLLLPNVHTWHIAAYRQVCQHLGRKYTQHSAGKMRLGAFFFQVFSAPVRGRKYASELYVQEDIGLY